MYPVKKCKEMSKGISKYNKNQLNELVLSNSNEQYLKRKNEKYDTTVGLVSLLTKKRIYN